MKHTQLIVLPLLLVGCSEGQTRHREPVHVFNWTDYISADAIPSFEAKSNRKVTYDNYTSNEELLAKLSDGNPGYDVIFPSAYAAQILKARGQLEPLVRRAIPNARYVLPQFAKPSFDPNMEFCVPYTASVTALAYDTTIIAKRDVESWDALFSPIYRDRILMLDDPRAVVGLALKRLGLSANSTDSSEIFRAGELLKAQKPLVHVYTNDNLPSIIGSGEVALAYAWSGDITQATKLNGKMRLSVPLAGTLLYVDYMCIPKGAPNPTGASEFINHVLEPSVALGIAREISYALPNSGAINIADTTLHKEMWGIILDSLVIKAAEPVRDVGNAFRFYDRVWSGLKQD